MNNPMYIRRKKKAILVKRKNNKKLENVYIATLLKNIESLGFTLSREIIDVLETFSITQIEDLHNKLVRGLKQFVGAHVLYEPMYPNFPKQVMLASQAELYTNAILHYIGDHIGVRIFPKYEKEKRAKLKDDIKLTVINLGDIDDFNSIFTCLASSKIAISETDKKDVEWFVSNYKDDIKKLLPTEVPLKENIALLGKLLVQYTDIADLFLKRNLKTATDILRFVVALSDGDVSLVTNTRFRNFKRKERKLILSLLEECGSIVEDMLRHKEEWKRVGERLHPFEYKQRFPRCFGAFDILRNNKPFSTFNREIEELILKKDINALVELLKKRPGEFARRLDHLLRLSFDPISVLIGFSEVAGDVSSTVLLQVLAHFKHRNKKRELRTFFPKGVVSKIQAIKNDLPRLNEAIRQKVVVLCKEKLIEKYKQLKPLGKVYLDTNLKRYTVPFSLRSASKALKTVGRGSKFDLPKGNTVRFFVWWKDGVDRTDLDLSVLALDENHAHVCTIAYYNLTEFGGYHSGDITSAPNGASEFIDINIENFLKSGIRYILMSVSSFTDQPFHDLPECFAGFMLRQHPNSGEIYEPKTVQNKFDITVDTIMCVPLIVDLQERKVIWTDLALNRNLSQCNNVYNNMSTLTLVNKAMTSLVKPNLYELFLLHVEARGEKTEDKKSANIIFGEVDGVTPFDTEQIIAEFL